MNDEFADKTLRLLDVIYALYGGEEDYPLKNWPFIENDDGGIVLSDALNDALNTDEHRDLIDWAHHNIANLFK
jgi:hypothetical protein